MDQQPSRAYRFLRVFVRLFYKKIELVGFLPTEPAVLVSNHCQMNGPLAAELYLPASTRIWCAAELMNCREVPGYAYRDFWSQKPGYSRWFYKLLSYAIVPLAVCLFRNARTVPVYHDSRALTAFKESVRRLERGEQIVIFPEHDEPYDNIVNGFQRSFVDLGRLYYRRTGKRLQFVPMYLSPKLRRWVVGQPLTYDPQNPAAQERERLSQALQAAISDLGRAQPEHTVIPYRKFPGVPYPRNK